MAVITRYLVESFQPTLPWSNCKPEWSNCIPSGHTSNTTNILSYTFNYMVKDESVMSSSEYYFM